MAAIGLGIPVVIAAERNVIRRPGWQVAIEQGLDRMTDAYLVNSDASVAEVTDHGGLPREKIVVIRNGIDLEGLTPFDPDRRKARAHLGFAPERRLVAQVGRLTDQKDYPTYLAEMAEVATVALDVDFLIVGEGEARTALEAEFARRRLGERIRFTGLPNDVPLLLGAVAVLCLTSVHESLPNVVIEAMAMGAGGANS